MAAKPAGRGRRFSEGKENRDKYHGGGGGGGGGGSGFQDAAAAKHAHQQEVRTRTTRGRCLGAREVHGGAQQDPQGENIRLSPQKKMLPAQRRALEKQQQQLKQDAGSPRVLIPDGWDTGSKPNSKGALFGH